MSAGYTFDGPALELGGLRGGRPSSMPTPRCAIPLAMMNRHGLVAGATGTGKTKTLQLIAEQLSAAGVPVFLADIKGDLSGLATPGAAERPDHPARGRDRPAVGADRLPGASSSRSAARAPACPYAPRSPSFGPIAAGEGARPQRDAGVARSAWSSTTPTQAGLPLLDLKDLRAVVAVPDQRRGQGRPEGARRAVHGDRRGDPARADRASRTRARDAVLRRARVRHRRPAAHRPRRARGGHAARAARRAGPARRCSRRS